VTSARPFDFEHQARAADGPTTTSMRSSGPATTPDQVTLVCRWSSTSRGLGYGELISKEDEKTGGNGKPLTRRNLPFLDFRKFPLRAEALDDHTFAHPLAGQVPEFKYWLTMRSFSRCLGSRQVLCAPGHERAQPQHELRRGTGPYMLTDTRRTAPLTVTQPNFRRRGRILRRQAADRPPAAGDSER